MSERENARETEGDRRRVCECVAVTQCVCKRTCQNERLKREYVGETKRMSCTLDT